MKHKILVVDDDPISSMLLTHFLRKDYSVTSTSTIAKTLQALQSQAADILILDYALPDGTALDILKYVGAHNLKSKCIVVTKFSNQSIVTECRANGAIDFIQKPVDPTALLEVLHLALDDKGAHTPQPKVRDSNGPVILNLDQLKASIGNEAALLSDILSAAEHELHHLSMLLKALPLDAYTDRVVKDLLFHLHRIESISLSIFAEDLARCVQDLSASILRRERTQLSDLEFLFKEINNLLKVIQSTLTQRP